MDKLLNNPTSLKIIAVLIAVLIWAVVHIDPETSPQSVTSNTDTKVIEAVPIVADGLDRDKYILTAMEPTVARLVVEGRISSLMTATNDDYVVKLNLKGIEPGIQELPLTVELPSGIKEVEISPRVVTVQVEALETQTREVQVITEGKPAEGYIIGESSIVGETGNVVEVTMPVDDYARLGMVAVTVDVTDATSTVTNKKAKVVAYDTQGTPMNNVTIVPDTLTAETKITLPAKELPVQLRYTGSLPDGYSLISISTNVDKVKVNARQEQLEQLAMFDGFILNLSEVRESGEVMVGAVLSDGIAAVTPSEIPVNVVVEKTERRLMNNVPLTIIGLADDMKINVNDSSNARMNIVVKGATSLLQMLKLSDIKLTLDVTNVREGTHELTVAAELPAYLQVEESDEHSLTVSVKITKLEQEVETITDPDTDLGASTGTGSQPGFGDNGTNGTSNNVVSNGSSNGGSGGATVDKGTAASNNGGSSSSEGGASQLPEPEEAPPSSEDDSGKHAPDVEADEDEGSQAKHNSTSVERLAHYYDMKKGDM